MEKKTLPIGEHFDSRNGTYNGIYVQELAIEYGWPKDKAVLDQEHEDFHEAWTEAEDYLNNFTPEGYWFGNTENGDWGVWKNEEEEGYEEEEDSNEVRDEHWPTEGPETERSKGLEN